MKKLMMTAALGTAVLALAACDSAADDAATDAGDTTIVEYAAGSDGDRDHRRHRQRDAE